MNEPPNNEMEAKSADEAIVNRRSLLEMGSWLAAGATITLVGGTGARFLIGDSLAPQPGRWVTVAPIVELIPGQMHKAVFRVRGKDAWREVEQKGVLYIYTDDGVAYTVLDATCTHTQCNVHWKAESGYFDCPCHGARFSRDGEVLRQPASGPLRRLTNKVENEILMAMI